MAAGTQLLVIDPQNDFCDVPGAALPVTGADADLRRLAAFIDDCADGLSGLHVTQDTHHPLDIAHPGWWQDAAGASPPPFTVITATEVGRGRWMPADPSLATWAAHYLQRLEERGKYQLVIWPEHCLIGGWGAALHPAVFAAVNAWSRRRHRQVRFHRKGLNPLTEHYSALEAEVPHEADPATRADPQLLAELAVADHLIVAGEALSHCVAGTVRDLVRLLGAEIAPRLTLLVDCTSPVAGFERQGQEFLAEMAALGVRFRRSTQGLPA